MNRRSAFTSIELMIVIVVVAILTVVAMSDSDSAKKEQAQQASLRFTADVTYARSLAIARPDDPVIVKVDEAGNCYWLAHTSDPATPIAHPQTGDPYIVSFGAGGTASLDEVEIVGCDFDGGDILTFDSVGDAQQGEAATLYFSSCGAACQVLVGPRDATCFDFDFDALPAMKMGAGGGGEGGEGEVGEKGGEGEVGGGGMEL